MIPRTAHLFFLVLLASFANAEEPAPAARQAIERWLDFQKKIRTVEADFAQSRELRTLRSAIRSEGKVWIDRPGKRFRWQAGSAEAPTSIAVKTGDTLTLIQPGRKRAETVSLAKAAAGQGGSAAAAFDFAAGELPANYAGLTGKFTLLGAKQEADRWRIRLSPKDARLREAVTEIVFIVDAAKYHLHGFDLTFRDGSKVATTFPRQKFNAKFDEALFRPDLTGYDRR